MKKLIELDAVIDALEKVAELFPWRVPGNRDSYDRYNEAWNDAIGRAEIEIEKLPSAQRWIPYDYENIPSPGENVLVTYKCDDGTSEVAEGVWIQPFIVNNCFMDREVIAWMPIQDPYKEGDK